MERRFNNFIWFLFAVAFFLVSCQEEEKTTHSVTNPQVEVVKNAWDTLTFVKYSSDSVHSPNGVIYQDYSKASEQWFQLNQCLKFSLNDSEWIQWQVGIIESIKDTTEIEEYVQTVENGCLTTIFKLSSPQ